MLSSRIIRSSDYLGDHIDQRKEEDCIGDGKPNGLLSLFLGGQRGNRGRRLRQRHGSYFIGSQLFFLHPFLNVGNAVLFFAIQCKVARFTTPTVTVHVKGSEQIVAAQLAIAEIPPITSFDSSLEKLFSVHFFAAPITILVSRKEAVAFKFANGNGHKNDQLHFLRGTYAGDS